MAQLTVQQAALFLKISEKSIRRYIKAGRLRAHIEKGQKGDEYRIEKEALIKLLKPQRGRPTEESQKSKVKSQKQNPKQKLPTTRYPLPTTTDFTPVGEIIKDTPERINHETAGLLNYKTLYEGLLNKYEQALVIVGSLEAQLAATPENYKAEIAQLRESLARQEELVLDLYQIVKIYKEEKQNNLPEQNIPPAPAETSPPQNLGEGETIIE